MDFVCLNEAVFGYIEQRKSAIVSTSCEIVIKEIINNQPFRHHRQAQFQFA